MASRRLLVQVQAALKAAEGHQEERTAAPVVERLVRRLNRQNPAALADYGILPR